MYSSSLSNPSQTSCPSHDDLERTRACDRRRKSLRPCRSGRPARTNSKRNSASMAGIPILYENPAIANHVSGTSFLDASRQLLKAISHLYYDIPHRKSLRDAKYPDGFSSLGEDWKTNSRHRGGRRSGAHARRRSPDELHGQGRLSFRTDARSERSPANSRHSPPRSRNG